MARPGDPAGGADLLRLQGRRTPRDLGQAIACERDGPDALAALLNELPAAPGDVYFIPARVAHAIGAGCLILEVQEPTDFTIQPEAWCGDYQLSSYEKYLGLPEETALECFDFEDLVGARAIAAGRKTPRRFASRGVRGAPDRGGGHHGLRREPLPHGGGAARIGSRPAVYVVTDGGRPHRGTPSAHGIAKGSSFFLPAAAGEAVLRSDSGLEIVECLPPRLSPA